MQHGGRKPAEEALEEDVRTETILRLRIGEMRYDKTSGSILFLVDLAESEWSRAVVQNCR